MVDRYNSECEELCHFPNDKGDWVYYEDYQRLEAENQRLINIAGDALGFSEYQRDQDTVEVLANHAKRLGEELAECKAELLQEQGFKDQAYAVVERLKKELAKERESILSKICVVESKEMTTLRARCERLENDADSMNKQFLNAVAEVQSLKAELAECHDQCEECHDRCERLEGALMHIKGLYENPSLTDSNDLYQISKQALEVPK